MSETRAAVRRDDLSADFNIQTWETLREETGEAVTVLRLLDTSWTRSHLPAVWDLRASTCDVRVETSFSLFNNFSIVSEEKTKRQEAFKKQQRCRFTRSQMKPSSDFSLCGQHLLVFIWIGRYLIYIIRHQISENLPDKIIVLMWGIDGESIRMLLEFSLHYLLKISFFFYQTQTFILIHIYILKVFTGS